MATNLPIADKTTLDEVKALIGAANPASGDLTTLFKGLKLIADYVDTLEASLASGISVIKSVQKGVITIPASSLSATATISAVNTSKSVPFYLGMSTECTASGALMMFPRLGLTSSTVVTATRGDDLSWTTVVSYAVVEFY